MAAAPAPPFRKRAHPPNALCRCWQAQNGALLLNNDVLELRELQKLRYAYASSRALFGALCVFDALAATGLWAVLEEVLCMAFAFFSRACSLRPASALHCAHTAASLPD